MQSHPLWRHCNVPDANGTSLHIFQGQVQQVKSYMQVIWDFIEVNVEQHKETYDPDNIRDFTDIYIASTRGEGEESKVSSKLLWHTVCYVTLISMVSCQKGPTRHAYAWQIGPFGRIPSISSHTLCLRKNRNIFPFSSIIPQ